MAGLSINLASFCFFFTLIIWYEVATRRIVRGMKRTYAPIVWAAMFSQILLIGRSIYRVIEFQQGYFSSIATTEIYFYFFDTLFMILATAVYIPFFPPAFGLLGKKRLALKIEEENIEMGRQREVDGNATEIWVMSLAWIPAAFILCIVKVFICNGINALIAQTFDGEGAF